MARARCSQRRYLFLDHPRMLQSRHSPARPPSTNSNVGPGFLPVAFLRQTPGSSVRAAWYFVALRPPLARRSATTSIACRLDSGPPSLAKTSHSHCPKEEIHCRASEPHAHTGQIASQGLTLLHDQAIQGWCLKRPVFCGRDAVPLGNTIPGVTIIPV